jgi:hypothetical protein
MQCFLDMFISINFSTCFGRYLRPSSGAQNCTYSVRYCQTNTAASCYRGCDGTPFHLIHDSSRAANTKLSSTIQCQNLWMTLRVNCYVGFICVGNFVLCQTVLISHFCKLRVTKTFWNNNFVEAHCTSCGRCLWLSQSSQICLGVSLKIRETSRALQSHRCFWKC